MDRPEHQVLLACARAARDEERPAIIRDAVAARFDWDYLLATAANHRLTSLLYWHLKAACPNAVPPDVLERLHRHSAWNSGVGLLLMARLQRILAAFEAGGVPAIPYKGPVLAHQLYENPSAREFDDLDILVEPRNLRRALALLPALGYQAARDYPPRVEREIFRREHHCYVAKPDGSEPVEIHWNIVNEFIGPAIPLARWWAKSQARPVAGRAVKTLSPEDLLVALCVHGAVHFWASLRWVADIARLLERHPGLDWSYIWGEHDRDVQRMVSLGLIVSHDAACAPVAEAAFDRAGQDPQAAALAREVRRRLFDATSQFAPALALRSTWFQMRLRTRLADRLAYPLRMASTPTLLEWDVRLPAALFPLYFALRPFRLAGKYARRLVGRGD